MKKILISSIVALCIATPALAAPGTATPYLHGVKKGWYVPKPPAGAVARGAGVSTGATMSVGATVTGGFISGIAVLVGYDWYRRMNCVDPWGLGGPGFDRPILPTDNVFVNPKCPVGRGR